MPVPPTDVVLIPGLWLDASSWQAPARWLTRAGHRVHPVTPWTASGPAAAVAELVALVDGLGADARVVVVGHSAGSGLAHALVDARPDRIARSVFIGGFPTPDGLPLVDGFEPVDGVVPLPGWDDLADEPDAEGLDAAAWADLAGRAVTVPETFVTEPQHLADERRLGVPVAVVCPEFQSSEPTDMTLGGLLKHLAYVEDHWFVRTLCGDEPSPPWDTVDWDADRDWDWHSALADDPEELWRLWFAAVRRSRAAAAEVLAADGITATAARSFGDDEPTPTLRWILTHMIEEYARHNGHADLLRQAVDGQVGE